MHAECTLWILFLRPGFTRVANLLMLHGAHRNTSLSNATEGVIVHHRMLESEEQVLNDATILEAPISMSTTSDDQAAAVSQPFHVTFGKVVADTKGLVPLAAPEWLEDSLLDDDDKRLNGKYILVNWGNDGDEPDWIVGKLSAKGEWELEGIEGNFKVSYAVEATTAVHVLRTNEYAESADEQVFIFGGHSFLIWQVDSPA